MTKDLKNDVVESNVVKPPKKKKIRSLEKRRSRAGWFFVLPFIIGLAVIYLPLIYESIYYSFTFKFTVRGVSTFQWCGFDNYAKVLVGEDAQEFLKVLVDGIGQLAMQIPAILMFSLFMAVILNQKMAGRAAFRAILFMPVILSTGIMELLSVDSSMNAMNEHMSSGSMDDGSGADAAGQIVNSLDIQQLLSGMKIGTELVDFVVGLINNIYDIVNRSGVQILIFLAGLQSISPAIYESCQVDGASGWETFWKITFPMISPMILVNGIYTVIDSFTSQSNVVMSYINRVYLYEQESGETLASAMSWIYFLLVILIIAVVFGLFSAFVFYQRRD